jgi:GTP-binding protein
MSDDTLPEQHFVTIVGRPNVGKSTLFNHLVGEERSITSEEAGTTRDRVSENLLWEDRELTLLDTAGYPAGEDPPDESFVLEQIDSMIERSECLLFVVDGREGLSELDRKIAEKLYPVSEKVLLVVNKIDPPRKIESQKAEFFELGFPVVEGVSAQHGRNLDSIQDWVTDRLPASTMTPEKYSIDDSGIIQISLVGRPNTGKSTLFNSVLGYERVMVSGQPGTTRDSVSVSFDAEGRRFELVDTGGMIRKNKVGGTLDQEIVYGSLRAINYSNVVGLVLDWNERVTHQDQRIAGLIRDRYRGCIILVNKADEVDEDAQDRWLDHLRDRLYFLDYAPVLFTSGQTDRGLGAIFRTATDVRDEMYTTFDREELVNTVLDLKTSLSWPSGDAVQVIVQELEQVEVNPITFKVVARNPEHLTGNDVRYLSRTLRDKLNIEVSPVKLRITRDDNDED